MLIKRHLTDINQLVQCYQLCNTVELYYTVIVLLLNYIITVDNSLSHLLLHMKMYCSTFNTVLLHCNYGHLGMFDEKISLSGFSEIKNDGNIHRFL